MEVLKQPHDKFFKAVFGKKDFTKDFLSNYLPAELINIIDLNTLEPQKDTYLDKNLKEQFSDLLFRIKIDSKESFIYLLFEHKSYKDKLVVFQLLRYMLEIWEGKIKSGSNVEIPIILPLVIYHDKGEWTVKKTLGGLIPSYSELPESLKKYIPNFEYLLFDLSQWPQEIVRLQTKNMVALKVLSKTRHATRAEIVDILIEVIQLINRAEEKESITYYVSECIRYILSIREDINEVEMKSIAERISTEGGELVMSVAERLVQEGMEKGMKVERIRMARNLMKINLPLEQIMTTTGLTKSEIEAIKV